MISADLFDFAFIPSWFEQLYELSRLAEVEPWRFKYPTYETQNDQTPILERYIKCIFRKQAIDYNGAPEEQADRCFYVRNEFACFHTGLHTPRLQAIYMCFERNKRQDTLKKWFFKGFATQDSPLLKYVQPLPNRPMFSMRQWMTYYDPEWQIRVHADHILGDPENIARLPESIRNAWNLPLLLETAVELARRKALSNWSIAVPQVFQGKIQYLLPIHLTNMEKPDLAMALSIMEGYYIGHTCLTLEMAYQNARILARPTARWLTQLVE